MTANGLWLKVSFKISNIQKYIQKYYLIDKRGKNGGGTLTCLGDPYSNSGSRCVPIEGLYIGWIFFF